MYFFNFFIESFIKFLFCFYSIMTEKEKLLNNLIEKSDKSKEELEKLVSDKIDELSGLVSEEGAIYIIANEIGVRLESEKPKREVEFDKIEKITEAKIPISLVAKVIRKYDKVNFSSEKGGDGCVQSILVGDDTGIMRIVFWHEKTEVLENIHDGDILKIINAYTRENNQNPGRIEIHYGQYSDIEVNPEGVEIELKEFKQDVEFTDKKVSSLEDGDRNVLIEGLVTDFDIPRFYLACPECFKKVLQNEGEYECAEHNDVEAIKVPIVNLIIDDGSGSINVVGFRNRAEDLTKFSSAEIIGLTEDINKYRNFSKRIVGSKIKFGGNVVSNSMTGEVQVMANQILNVDLKDVDEIAEELVAESDSNKKSTSKKEDKVDVDDLDMDIEEIDIDDDML